MEIRPLRDLGGLAELQHHARDEGFRLLDRLISDWDSGALRFDQEGEVLLGVFEEGRLIAVGGVRRQAEGVGRVSRVYVHPQWRRRGVGARLMAELIRRSRAAFLEIILRTDTKGGAAFYEALGFHLLVAPRSDQATYRMEL